MSFIEPHFHDCLRLLLAMAAIFFASTANSVMTLETVTGRNVALFGFSLTLTEYSLKSALRPNSIWMLSIFALLHPLSAISTDLFASKTQVDRERIDNIKER